MEGTMAKPKLRLVNEEDIDAELARQRMDAIQEFYSAWADYLEAQSRVVGPRKSDNEYARLDRELREARSRMMALEAPNKCQIGHKFEVLRDLIANDGMPEELREIVDSIERDVEWLEDWPQR
jgi:hypothetical protein